MSLKIDLVTLFPKFYESPLQESILKRAQKERQIRITVHNLRDYTRDKHRTADDKPFGGGAGMLMKPEPIFECVEAIREKGWVVLMDPRGRPFDQSAAWALAKKKHIILIAGHYEGVDQRVRDHLIDEEISVGDFVTMGGEAPALCVVEAVVRLIPGVLGNADSLTHESHHTDFLEYPQYTRPRDFRGWKVPEVLVSGHHEEVRKWRENAAKKITHKKRPNLSKKKRNPKSI